jgi:hypothetical protein
MTDRSRNSSTLTDDRLGTPATAPSQSVRQQSGSAANACRHCGAPREPDYPMCRKCGYYEKLNTFVEVDQIDVEKGASGPPARASLPRWAWILLGILLVILIESIAVTLVWPVNSLPRMIWSLAQLSLGLILAMVAHGRATFIAIMANSENEIGDCVIRPLRIWSFVSAELPRTLPWVAMGSGGLLGLLLSVFLIRSIPYNVLFETDGPPPKIKHRLAAAIVEQAKKAAAEEQSMEEAMKDFTDKAGVAMEQEELPQIREKTECVIVGYYAPDADPNGLSSILVAGVKGRKLQLLGTISMDIHEDVRASLNKQLRRIPRPTPFVETKLNANWVQPLYLCEISFTRDKKGEPNDLKFEKVTGTSQAIEPR